MCYDIVYNLKLKASKLSLSTDLQNNLTIARTLAIF